MKVAWEIVYITIAILVAVVFPFLIYFYESDDEGLTAMKSGAGKVGQMFSAASCGKAMLSALCYELVTLVIAIPVLILTWTYLGVTAIPVSSTSIDVGTGGAFFPSECWAHLCVCMYVCASMGTCLIWCLVSFSFRSTLRGSLPCSSPCVYSCISSLPPRVFVICCSIYVSRYSHTICHNSSSMW